MLEQAQEVENQALLQVEAAVKQATVIQSSRLFKRLDSPLGVAGFGDLGAIRVGRYLDPDVEQLLMPYRIMRNFS